MTLQRPSIGDSLSRAQLRREKEFVDDDGTHYVWDPAKRTFIPQARSLARRQGSPPLQPSPMWSPRARPTRVAANHTPSAPAARGACSHQKRHL